MIKKEVKARLIGRLVDLLAIVELHPDHHRQRTDWLQEILQIVVTMELMQI